MSDEFLPPGSFLWSESWPYWIPNTLLGMLPPLALPRVPGDQFGSHGLQQSFSANGEAASPPNDPTGGNAPAWLDPAISSRASGGILRSLTQSDGLLNQSPSAWAQSAMPFRASAGILAPLARAHDPREQSPPAWLQSVLRWSHEPSAATWDSSMLATPSTLAPVLPSAPQRAANSALIQTFAPIPTLAEVLSDADPQELVPGARYAQNSPRRGGTGPGGRDLSPPESIRLLLHSNAHRILRDLDPKNPQLESISSPTWVRPKGISTAFTKKSRRCCRIRACASLKCITPSRANSPLGSTMPGSTSMTIKPICQEIGIGYYRMDFIQVPRTGMRNGNGSLRRTRVQRKSRSWNS
jgi:hypothetical protein